MGVSRTRKGRQCHRSQTYRSRRNHVIIVQKGHRNAEMRMEAYSIYNTRKHEKKWGMAETYNTVMKGQ